jgi:hypothetical protein
MPLKWTVKIGELYISYHSEPSEALGTMHIPMTCQSRN